MERRFIRFLVERLSLAEDDASLIRGENFVVNVDAFDGEMHWYSFLGPFEVGWRATLSSVSDVLVKGAVPRWVLLSVRVPEWYDESIYRGVVEGAAGFCGGAGCEIVGGDTDVVGYGPFRVEVTVLGSVLKYVSRRGARPGDVVLSTGPFGLSWAMYRLWSGEDVCGLSYLREYGRGELVEADKWLSVVPYVTAAIDNSDGLALSLHYLSEASKVGILLENVPLHPAIKGCGGGLREALYFSGEEYQFVFTVPGGSVDRVLDLLGGYVIGRVVEGGGVRMADGNPVERRGWVGGEGYKQPV